MEPKLTFIHERKKETTGLFRITWESEFQNSPALFYHWFQNSTLLALVKGNFDEQRTHLFYCCSVWLVFDSVPSRSENKMLQSHIWARNFDRANCDSVKDKMTASRSKAFSSYRSKGFSCRQRDGKEKNQQTITITIRALHFCRLFSCLFWIMLIQEETVSVFTT